ncbi:hypothetical protein [Stakelama saccharophila]|uniref:Integrase n=1 Tax=Stakelama saccharophila TaxID=3075605 RepID=A0ABZ0B7S2_9SPHN|nr:hypothetical protein [Stakelama sp. W311]WNO53161.1 hypothetical protein RPR59_11990 [Stakelama sp. W311]
MALQNLRLRGGTYHWRRKITVRGHAIPLSMALNTGSFYHARSIAAKLEAMLEDLRVAYGQEGTVVQAAQLKQVFKDALRWQLRRIQTDQIASPLPSDDHARANSIHAEAWRFLAQNGTDAPWTIDEHDRLLDAGWSNADAMQVATFLFDNTNGAPVSGRQIDQYADSFGIAKTETNVSALKRIICEARAAACRKATETLSPENFDYSDWVDEAMEVDDPLAFEEAGDADADADPSPPPQSHPKETMASAPPETEQAVARSDNKKLLRDACEDCISAYVAEGAWSDDTVKQVRTAITLFDYACGTDGYVEDVSKKDVLEFKSLCREIPNRWGRTTDEQKRGIIASLERAASLPAEEVGISQITMNKHISWIDTVLQFAASDQGGEHRTADDISWKQARQGLGKRKQSQRKRDRDRRANWTHQEIKRLLSAPIWTGCAHLDDRLNPGKEIYHDGWYWLPLMLALYGGRSAELVALPMSDIHEDQPIPFFQIDYTEDRDLKNVQSIRKLPIHPELIRLGFIDYVSEMRALGHKFAFPEMRAPGASSFASTFYKSAFKHLRKWAFPQGTAWRHKVGGAWIDKDTHSFRGAASSVMKGKVEDSVRCDILGHEGETETARTYDEEAELSVKLDALKPLSLFTKHIEPVRPVRLRPADRQKHGARRGRPKKK